MKAIKRSFSLILSVLMVLTLALYGLPVKAISNWNGSVGSSFQGGNGTENNPYKIATAKQLAYFASKVNSGNTYGGSYFVLTDDINLSGINWTPIGVGTNIFGGKFNGNGHKIIGLTINSSSDHVGLFGGSYGTIENLRIIQMKIKASAEAFVGGIAAACSTNISNCSASGTITCALAPGKTSGYTCCVGGIVGDADGNISNCYSNCTISTDYYDAIVGGLTGRLTGKIKNSYSKGSVSATGSGWIGGLLGTNYSDIENCYTTCSVKDTAGTDVNGYVGGITGYAISPEITNCYEDSTVTGGPNQYVGNFAGYTNQSGMKNDYWNSERNPINKYGNGASVDNKPDESVGMTTKAMQSSLKDKLNAKLSTGYAKWVYISGKNDNCPLLNGVGDGDTTKPIFGKVKYSKTALTNKNVTVTIAVKNMTASSVSHTFTSNGSYTFTICNSIGNMISKTVKITNIDMTEPVIKISFPGNNTVNCRAVVSVSDAHLKSKSITLNNKAISWGKGVFKSLGTYVVKATDKAGNTSTKSFYLKRE